LETGQTSEGNGVDLANLVPAISMVSGGAVFYLAGIPRAAGFETRLEKLHVPYRVAECYHMEEIPYEAGFLPRLFRETWPQAVLLYCRGTAEQFFRLVADAATGLGVLKDLRILCLGAAIAEVVPFAYRENVAIAPISKEDCLLTLFEEA